MFLVLPLHCRRRNSASLESRDDFVLVLPRPETSAMKSRIFLGGMQTFSANQGNILCTRLREYARASIELRSGTRTILT